MPTVQEVNAQIAKQIDDAIKAQQKKLSAAPSQSAIEAAAKSRGWEKTTDFMGRPIWYNAATESQAYELPNDVVASAKAAQSAQYNAQGKNDPNFKKDGGQAYVMDRGAFGGSSWRALQPGELYMHPDGRVTIQGGGVQGLAGGTLETRTLTPEQWQEQLSRDESFVQGFAPIAGVIGAALGGQALFGGASPILQGATADLGFLGASEGVASGVGAAAGTAAGAGSGVISGAAGDVSLIGEAAGDTLGTGLNTVNPSGTLTSGVGLDGAQGLHLTTGSTVAGGTGAANGLALGTGTTAGVGATGAANGLILPSAISGAIEAGTILTPAVVTELLTGAGTTVPAVSSWIKNALGLPSNASASAVNAAATTTAGSGILKTVADALGIDVDTAKLLGAGIISGAGLLGALDSGDSSSTVTTTRNVPQWALDRSRELSGAISLVDVPEYRNFFGSGAPLSTTWQDLTDAKRESYLNTAGLKYALDALDQDFGVNRNKLAAASVRNNAFGGSRYGVQEAALQGETDKNKTLARSTAFTNAFDQYLKEQQQSQTDWDKTQTANIGAANTQNTNLISANNSNIQALSPIYQAATTTMTSTGDNGASPWTALAGALAQFGGLTGMFGSGTRQP